ncbi:MAG: division/cell wall cluster transcriptional repressor MraZ [Coriobacteriia bacterium]|nr:division/cell wall cluster transcriptional repressor MraZ [Coriobacteriia bacterium]
MFLGEYQHTLDAKGRVSLPAKFREQMTGRVVVAKGFEKCLYVYPSEDYSQFVQRLMGRDDFDPKYRAVRRFFTAGAVEAELDSAGRVRLPEALREYAGLGKEVQITGNGNRIEVWDAATWSSYEGETTSDIEELAKELADAGLL